MRIVIESEDEVPIVETRRVRGFGGAGGAGEADRSLAGETATNGEAAIDVGPAPERSGRRRSTADRSASRSDWIDVGPFPTGVGDPPA